MTPPFHPWLELGPVSVLPTPNTSLPRHPHWGLPCWDPPLSRWETDAPSLLRGLALAQGTVQKFTLPSLLGNYAVGQMWSWSFLRRGERPGAAEGSRRAPRHCPGDWPSGSRAGPGGGFLHPLPAPPQLQHRQETETKPKHQWSLASSYHPGQENATCKSAAWSRRPSCTPRRPSCGHLPPRRMAKPTPMPRPGHPWDPGPRGAQRRSGPQGPPCPGPARNGRPSPTSLKASAAS